MATIEPGASEVLTVVTTTPGGGWCYFWSGPQLAPIWWPAGHPPSTMPEYWPAVYFSLAPRKTRLPGKRRGGLDDLMYLTCLYSELDEKDGRTWSDVENLDPQPSAIIRSGGGWHLYWLVYPVTITSENREELNRTQHRWTAYTGGDPGAPDISRVLRVPGSYNCKYNPPRKVEVILLSGSLRYDLRDLMGLLPEEEAAGGMVGISSPAYSLPKADRGSQTDPEYWLSRALSMAAPGNRNRVGFWLALQLRDAGLSQLETIGVMDRYQAQVTNHKDPYTRQEAKDAVRSAYRTAAREPAPKGTL